MSDDMAIEMDAGMDELERMRKRICVSLGKLVELAVRDLTQWANTESRGLRHISVEDDAGNGIWLISSVVVVAPGNPDRYSWKIEYALSVEDGVTVYESDWPISRMGERIPDWGVQEIFDNRKFLIKKLYEMSSAVRNGLQPIFAAANVILL